MTGRATGALAALLLGLAAVMAVWLSIDRRPPEWDHANHRAGRAPAPFTLHVDGVSYGGVRLPGLLVRWIVRNFDPTPRLRRLPMAVSVAPISIGAGRVEIGRDPDPSCLPKESR